MSKISIELDKSFSDKLDEMIKTIELNIQKDLSVDYFFHHLSFLYVE